MFQIKVRLLWYLSTSELTSSILFTESVLELAMSQAPEGNNILNQVLEHPWIQSCMLNRHKSLKMWFITSVNLSLNCQNKYKEAASIRTTKSPNSV